MGVPSGTVTFLFTDMEGSTRRWEEDPDAMRVAAAKHDEVVRGAIEAHGGYVFATGGDGFAAAFGRATAAVAAAHDAQAALTHVEGIAVRMGVSTGEVHERDGDYFGPAVNRTARLMAAAHGGQVLVSGAAEALVRGQLPQGIELIDLGEHRLRDLGRPTRVFQLSEEGRPADFPPLRTLDAFPGNLPAQVSSFIGRESEVSRVASALVESRAVTLTGVGGVGETRLALQVAADLLPRYREGAWLVELEPVRDPEGVVEAVAAVFHLTGRVGQSLDDSLVESLAPKQLLLVLDNCEHLLGAVARLVARLARSCPEVGVLATSREGMAIEGEQLLAVPPLEAGEPGQDVGHLIHTDAVRLFVERARSVKVDFALTETNASAVVEACQRLDGVPLAIELAAARVIALSPAELVQRLDRRFQVLAGGRRGAIERHATLRAAIDWSYELLSVAEQRLLARLAVFSGGCTLEAIEKVCSGDPVERDAVFDLLAGLVSRSLVVAEDHGAGTRYRLLETIRQYGEERVSEHEETESLRVRHASFYAALVGRASERVWGPEQIAWAKQVVAERDNILSAIANAIDAGNAGLAVRLVAHTPSDQNSIGEIFPLPASRVLDLVGAEQQAGYPRVVVAAAFNASHRGDHDLAAELYQQALEASQHLPDPVAHPGIEAAVCSLRAQESLAAGSYDEAVSLYRRAAELARADGYAGAAAISLAYSVSASLLAGRDAEAAGATAEESVHLARQSGMPSAIALSLNALALTLVDRDPVRARAVLRESVQRSAKPGEELRAAFVTAQLVAGRLQDWSLTPAVVGRSMRLYRFYTADIYGATCLAECARAMAETQPEAAGVLQGAAYKAFGRASPRGGAKRRSDGRPADPNANFVLVALRQTGALVAAALGTERHRQLRTVGLEMTTDEAISYALAHIDPQLLAGPLTFAPPETSRDIVT